MSVPLTKEKKSGKADLFLYLTFAAALLLRGICYLQSVRLEFRMDDFGPLIVPAYLAGYDWTHFSPAINGYYGFGYYCLFFPLFRLIRSPEMLLAVIAAVNAVLVALSSMLIYRILVKYADLPGNILTVVMAVLPTFFIGNTGTGNFWYRTDNELPLYFVCWLAIWILLKARQSLEAGQKTRIVQAVAMALLLSWGLSVHERTMSLLLAVLCVEVFLFLSKRKWLLQPAAFGGTLVVGFLIQRYLRKVVIALLWMGGSPKKNTTVLSHVSLWFLESALAFKTLLIVLFGNLHSLMVRGFGIPAFAAAIAVIWCVKQFPVLRKKFFAEDEAVKSEWVDPCILVMLTFGICIVITILGVAVRWGSLLLPAMVEKKVTYYYKGINYPRYYFTYIGPVLLGTLAYFRRKAPVLKSHLAAGWGLFLAVEGVFFWKVFPYLQRAEDSTYVERALGSYVFRSISNQNKMILTMGGTVLVMLLVTAAVFPLKKCGNPARRISCFLASASLVILLAFSADRFLQVKWKAPKISFGAIAKEATLIRELSEAGKLTENVYLPYTRNSLAIQFIDRDLSFLHMRQPKKENWEQDNMVWMTKEKKAYIEAGYELVRYKTYFIYINNPEAADAFRTYTNP